MTEDANYLWTKRYEALYRAELSSLYHRKRERFFENFDRIAKVIAIIGGSVAFANVGGPELVRWSAAVITLTSTVALVFGLGERARRHAELASEFARVQSDIVAHGERDFSEEDIRRWDERTRLLEAKEPATLGALAQLCQNQLNIAHAHPERVMSLPWYQRLLAHFWDFPATIV